MTKSVLITRPIRALGKGLAGQFAARGYRLALTGRSMADLEVLPLAADRCRAVPDDPAVADAAQDVSAPPPQAPYWGSG